MCWCLLSHRTHFLDKRKNFMAILAILIIFFCTLKFLGCVDDKGHAESDVCAGNI